VRYCSEKTSPGLHPPEKNAAVPLDKRSELKQFTIVIPPKFSTKDKNTSRTPFVAFL